jgi:hypothetical protein
MDKVQETTFTDYNRNIAHGLHSYSLVTDLLVNLVVLFTVDIITDCITDDTNIVLTSVVKPCKTISSWEGRHFMYSEEVR